MPTPTRRVAPLYAAGFVTAFGAHGIAATLGVYTHDRHASLLVLAVYDGAEVVLNPSSGHWPTESGPDRCYWVGCWPSPGAPPRS